MEVLDSETADCRAPLASPECKAGVDEEQGNL
eukprot:CAMPEP_0170619068 /NCGR_PEP_ID=MMETSP0224-20130122/27313_1 /TAXON_ID=285029 /ORGANISM="Togula jolla, Strain CCCM 725" /LENGTH=31 /DNA_ID= /DNA_START= /DNA_END= /DNA_ORIENTATION=